MKAYAFRMTLIAILMGLLITNAASGWPIDIPDPEDIEDEIVDIVEDFQDLDYILGNLPGFGLGMDQDDPITTSFDDCVTDVPFLDSYPAAPITGDMDFMPMCELPRGADGFHQLMPGRYGKTIETFCLHAGTHGPGHGEGYLYAPLKGPWTGIVRDILRNSCSHPEIPQRDIQTLVWAVLARTKLSDMNPEMQGIARVLLSDDQVGEINMGAFEIIPRDLTSEVFQYIDVPPAVEQVMRAESEIRYMMTSGYSSYEELEAVAILSGDPLSTDEDREIPADRWSYHPDGYFTRYEPHGYPSTDVEIVVPDKCEIEIQNREFISSMEDEHGNRLVVDGTTLTYECLDPENPWDTLSASWSGFDVESLVSSGWTSEHRAEVTRLVGDSEWVDMVVEIGKFAKAVEIVASGELSGDAADLAKEVWMDAIVRVTHAPDSGELLSRKEGSGLPDFDWRDRWRPYDPSGDSANPASRGRQRLGGRDPRPSEDPDWSYGDDPRIQDYKPIKRPPAHTAREGMNEFSGMNDKLSWIQSGPIGSAVNSIGFAIPNAIFGGLMEFNITLWDYCTGALSTDPPRSDYDRIIEPEHFSFTPLQSPEDGPPARVAALNAFMVEGLKLGAYLKAAVISVDRQGGASMAGDQHWAYEQAKTVVYYERQSGYAMYRVANLLDAYLAVLRAEGITDIYITPDDYRDGQERLEREGFTSEQLAAAHLLGMSDANVQAYKDYLLSLDPNEASGSIMEAAENLSASLRGYGHYLISLPDVREEDISVGFVGEIAP